MSNINLFEKSKFILKDESVGNKIYARWFPHLVFLSLFVLISFNSVFNVSASEYSVISGNQVHIGDNYYSVYLDSGESSVVIYNSHTIVQSIELGRCEIFDHYKWCFDKVLTDENTEQKSLLLNISEDICSLTVKHKVIDSGVVKKLIVEYVVSGEQCNNVSAETQITNSKIYSVAFQDDFSSDSSCKFINDANNQRVLLNGNLSVGKYNCSVFYGFDGVGINTLDRDEMNINPVKNGSYSIITSLYYFNKFKYSSDVIYDHYSSKSLSLSYSNISLIKGDTGLIHISITNPFLKQVYGLLKFNLSDYMINNFIINGQKFNLSNNNVIDLTRYSLYCSNSNSNDELHSRDYNHVADSVCELGYYINASKSIDIYLNVTAKNAFPKPIQFFPLYFFYDDKVGKDLNNFIFSFFEDSGRVISFKGRMFEVYDEFYNNETNVVNYVLKHLSVSLNYYDGQNNFNSNGVDFLLSNEIYRARLYLNLDDQLISDGLKNVSVKIRTDYLANLSNIKTKNYGLVNSDSSKYNFNYSFDLGDVDNEVKIADFWFFTKGSAFDISDSETKDMNQKQQHYFNLTISGIFENISFNKSFNYSVVYEKPIGLTQFLKNNSLCVKFESKYPQNTKIKINFSSPDVYFKYNFSVFRLSSQNTKTWCNPFVLKKHTFSDIWLSISKPKMCFNITIEPTLYSLIHYRDYLSKSLYNQKIHYCNFFNAQYVISEPNFFGYYANGNIVLLISTPKTLTNFSLQILPNLNYKIAQTKYFFNTLSQMHLTKLQIPATFFRVSPLFIEYSWYDLRYHNRIKTVQLMNPDEIKIINNNFDFYVPQYSLHLASTNNSLNDKIVLNISNVSDKCKLIVFGKTFVSNGSFIFYPQLSNFSIKINTLSFEPEFDFTVDTITDSYYNLTCVQRLLNYYNSSNLCLNLSSFSLLVEQLSKTFDLNCKVNYSFGAYEISNFYFDSLVLEYCKEDLGKYELVKLPLIKLSQKLQALLNKIVFSNIAKQLYNMNLSQNLSYFYDEFKKIMINKDCNNLNMFNNSQNLSFEDDMNNNKTYGENQIEKDSFSNSVNSSDDVYSNNTKINSKNQLHINEKALSPPKPIKSNRASKNKMKSFKELCVLLFLFLLLVIFTYEGFLFFKKHTYSNHHAFSRNEKDKLAKDKLEIPDLKNDED